MDERKKKILQINVDLIKQFGSPHSRYILYRDILCDDEQQCAVKQELTHDSRIVDIFTRLFDSTSGINSLLTAPADYKFYGSYYWKLRFLADVGFSRAELPLDEIIEKLFIFQLPDGQYTIDFYRKTRTPVTAICITAHLTYILAAIGYKFHRSVQAAFAHILATQRKDGGWHCDWKKQVGESEENAASCPVANLQIARALSVFGSDYYSILANAMMQVYNFVENYQTKNQACDFGYFMVSQKLRYPPHYHGLDILNLLDSLSNFPQGCTTPMFEKMIRSVILKWDGSSFFKSEKTVPEWKNFDFGKNNRYSDWISCLVCRILSRAYSEKS